MNLGLFTAILSAAAAISVAILTYLLTKRKEREADWRKLKLELYRAYVLALSGVVKENRTADDQAKYADAVNSLTLVASSNVLKALYSFQDAISQTGEERQAIDPEKYLDALLKALRQDIYPRSNGSGASVRFRFMSPPARLPGAPSNPISG